jgi:type IV secretion system pilin
MSRTTKIVSALAIVLMLVSVPLVGFHTPAYADNSSDVCAGAGIATNDSGTGCPSTTSGPDVTTIVTTAISILSIIVGLIAVIMVIVGGFRYIISGGDSSSVNNAKNTILYALVGLAVAVSAEALVHFVLSKIK